MVFALDTLPCYHNCLCHITLKLHHAWQNYGLGINMFHCTCEQSFSADCDFDLWPREMALACDTLSCHDNHLCQIIFKSHHAIQSSGPDKTGFTEAYAQSARANCDLDLWPGNMILAWETPSCHEIIFKSHHAGQSYEPNMILETHTHGQVKLYMPFRHFMAGA